LFFSFTIEIEASDIEKDNSLCVFPDATDRPELTITIHRIHENPWLLLFQFRSFDLERGVTSTYGEAVILFEESAN
jgi:hypothetical protein